MTGVLPLLTRIAEARSAEAVWSLATGHFADLGFARSVYRLLRTQREDTWPDPANQQFFSTLGPRFTRQHLETGFFSTSAQHRWAECNEGACTWAWLPRAIDADDLSPEEAETERLTRDLGIVAGITVAFPRIHARTRAALVLIADKGLGHDDVEQIWSGHREEIVAIAHVMHLSLLQQPAGLAHNRLTQRQRETLEWVADGKTSQDVALLMGISPAMVEKHLRLAREALDVDTTTQAVARAVALNLLFPARHIGQTYTKEVGNP